VQRELLGEWTEQMLVSGGRDDSGYEELGRGWWVVRRRSSKVGLQHTDVETNGDGESGMRCGGAEERMGGCCCSVLWRCGGAMTPVRS
jgi:hypothetical protein